MRKNTWVVRVTQSREPEVFAGQNVEVQDGMVCEGAWAGEFTREGFLSSEFRCGSGIVFYPDRFVLVAPTHSVESVYCYKENGKVCVSNSMHAIQALEPSAYLVPTDDIRVSANLVSAGRLNYERLLYRTSNGAMFRFAFSNITISVADLSITEHAQVIWSANRLHDFKAYADLLHTTVAGVVQNARDSGRSQPYGDLITTVSAGYDSAACASLAKQLGCNKALTIRSARGGTTDTGRPVAEALGLTCYEYDRWGADIEELLPGKKNPTVDARRSLPEHRDFFGSIHTSEDLYFAPFAAHISDALVLTGFHGDKVWAKDCPSGPMIVRGDNSGTGIDEFRRRVGFVNIPVPFIGAEFYEDISRIGASDEMKPWSVGGSYDRPIPRRLAEDQGVSRSTFGTKKAAASLIFTQAKIVRQEAFASIVEEYRSSILASQRESRAMAS